MRGSLESQSFATGEREEFVQADCCDALDLMRDALDRTAHNQVLHHRICHAIRSLAAVLDQIAEPRNDATAASNDE